jgi:hypothetical protein
VGFCNPEYLRVAGKLRKLGCKIVWVNCMTFLFDHEKNFFRDHGPADAMVYQSEFQRAEIEPQLVKYKYNPATGYLIRGAFQTEDWEFRPRPHVHGDVFVLGRLARPDADKWSSNTWPIYNRVQYRSKRALMLGIDDRVHAKLGKPPTWADCLKPQAIPVQQFYSTLHCLLPVNGGAKENWPRAGLEAMAAGVPVVAQNEWGWREMILHGETGFLGSCDEELAHYAATLAYDENLRVKICKAARERLVDDLARPETIWSGWEQLFENVAKPTPAMRATA